MGKRNRPVDSRLAQREAWLRDAPPAQLDAYLRARDAGRDMEARELGVLLLGLYRPTACDTCGKAVARGRKDCVIFWQGDAPRAECRSCSDFSARG